MPGIALPHTESAGRKARGGPASDKSAGTFVPARWLIPYLVLAAVASGALGIYIGFFVTPVEPHRGDLHRIVYVHVPATWMAILLFFGVAVCAGVGRLARTGIASMLAQAMAPTGTTFAFMALWTGALWGKPIWGTWWIWDMRPVTDLVLLLLYLSVLGVYAEFEEPERADRIVARIAVAGSVVVLALLLSVALYPSIPSTPNHVLPAAAAIRRWTAAGLFAVSACFLCYSGAIVLRRLSTVKRERRRHGDWSSRHSLEA